MLDAATQQRVRQLHLVTKRLMDGPLVGDDVTARKGYGIEFHQIRDYQTGDDVRFIDWRGSARLGRLLTKECLQERNRTVIVAVDVSASAFYGSNIIRIEKLREIATILLFAAHHARDSIGLLLCADDILVNLPAKNISSYVHVLIERLYTHVSSSAPTNLARLFTHVAQSWRKDALIFVISDFIDDNFHDALVCAARHADIVGIRCTDPVEHMMPRAGLLLTRDIETGREALIDVGSVCTQRALKERFDEQNELFSRVGIDVLDVSYESDACALLIEFFKRRMIHHMVRSWS